MNDLKEWLSSEKDYKQGVLLYEKYCRNKILLRSFQRGVNEYNSNKLLYELRNIYKEPLSIIEVSIIDLSEIDKKRPSTVYPEELGNMIIEQGKWYRDRIQLSNSLRSIPDQDGRKIIIDRILELEKKSVEVSRVKKYFMEHGSMPAPKEPEKSFRNMNKADLILQRNNIRANISKKERKIKELYDNPVKRVKYETEKVKLTEQLKEIEAYLKQ